ncbi:glycosyltransferase [Liquorilactobacillus mali]|uniref:glycosyltransferase n=1 Tax=Liquorilactobacillus mali TaxID=1618 RepID=UPI002952E41C|nr:glycosyltransferase [Liquorilactobacillus mali]MDV7757570.1 multidrug MFS transporter [Liquorilactobacillus mali]
MIFVTVGTHEQPFDRLIWELDRLKRKNIIKEKVIAQIGYCTYIPQEIEYQKFFEYDKMLSNIKNARIVITHGAPASFIMPLRVNKIPIVVPRRKKFNEHINNHQVEFSLKVYQKYKNIILVEKIDELKDAIENYDLRKSKLKSATNSNNTVFVNNFEKLIEQLF